MVMVGSFAWGWGFGVAIKHPNKAFFSYFSLWLKNNFCYWGVGPLKNEDF
jgi:hypothetical protein